MEKFKAEYAPRYYLQIKSQCEFAIEALRQLQSLFNSKEKDFNFASHTEVFMLATSFLSSVANVDKIFTNSNPRKNHDFVRERTDFLKSAFEGLYDRLPSKNIRNAIEHFDEKIDDHVATADYFIDQTYATMPAEVKESMGVFNIPSTVRPNVPVFRHFIYVPSTKEIYIQMLGEEMNLTEVELTIRSIKIRCDQLLFPL
ncbi:hypothetical protein JY98_03725 [Exiguobacterium mexicanum]|nr:hypothetical protein JY98_03725 [Exiguobacterium mexicanum]